MTEEYPFNKFPDLKSDRLHFKNLDCAYLKEIYKLRSDEKIMKYMGTSVHMDITQSKKFIDESQERYKDNKGIFFAIHKNSDGEFIGYFVICDIDIAKKKATIGYALNSTHWKKGYMREAANCLIKYTFENLEIDSLVAEVDPNNLNSIKLLLQLGFYKVSFADENKTCLGYKLDSHYYSLPKQVYKKSNHQIQPIIDGKNLSNYSSASINN